MDLTEDDVIQILRLLDESSFEELQLEMGGLKLMVRKQGSRGITKESGAGSPSSRAAALVDTKISKPDSVPPMDPYPAKATGLEASQAVDIEKEGLIPVYSPMLGTFYRAPSPGAPPFVEVGSLVAEEDTLCIIEVMKLYSAIKASNGGRVAKICAENGQMVEYNQILFLIEPANH